MIPSQHSQLIKPFLVIEMQDRYHQMLRAGEDVISLCIGEPDLPVPTCIQQAGIKSLQANFTQYTSSLGLLELREAIVAHYRQKYSVSISADQVLITAGSSPAFLLVLMALLDAGDSVILPNLHYPCYPNFIRLAHGQVQEVEVKPAYHFHYDPLELKHKLTPRTKAIFVSSPANPTGAMIPDDVFEAISKLGTCVISDEIYHGLCYEKRERCVLEFTDNAFVINSFSKAYCMPGFRLGYVISPKSFAPLLHRIQQSVAISVTSFVQKAGVAALTQAQADQSSIRDTFKKRRDLAIDALKKIGLSTAAPVDGAFYLWVKIPHAPQGSYAWTLDCLEKGKVGVSPGIDFGKGGEGYFRISYANSEENILEGIRRIGAYISQT